MNVLDLFSGIGGFPLGIKQSGIKIGWHGYSDVDKYANKLYKRRFPNAKELGSVTDVSYKSLEGKRIDFLTGGFPCQAFSIAGKRRGFDDTRGTLFFEIARILEDYIKNGKPIPCILLENVKGLLSHDNKRTFITIYKILTNLNYTLECQVVNTKWWLPQNRERIFIFGRYNGNPSGRKVFPIGKNDIKVGYVQRQCTNTIAARYEAGATGSYIIEGEQHAQKKGINIIGHSGTGGQRGDIHSPNGIASCLSATDYKQPQQVLNQIGTLGKDNQANRIYSTDGISKTLTDGGGGGAKTGLYKVLTGNIRKLTPTECERLQGFPDGWTDEQSDTQRYKQLGNAVTVTVVKAIVEKIYDMQ